MTCDATSFDELWAQTRDGDPTAETRLFAALRVRFLALAKRRVHEDHAEDVVQDALKIVFDRYGECKQGPGILVWGLTVLRNVIGNHYQAKQRERGRLSFTDQTPDAVVEMPDLLMDTVGRQTQDRLLAAIEQLARRFPRCGHIFAGLLASLEQGGSPHQVSGRALALVQKQHPELSRGSFYTALHRCRGHLRAILESPDEGANHVGT